MKMQFWINLLLAWGLFWHGLLASVTLQRTAAQPVNSMVSIMLLPKQISTAYSNQLSPQAAPVRRVNAPYAASNLRPIDAAIFWFGRVNATDNYADVRVGYTDTHLIVWLHIIDRRLWHLTQPTPASLTLYDAASLFLSLDGNVGASVDVHEFRFTGMESSSATNPAAQAAYRGNGTGWSALTTSFVANSGWRGVARNDDGDDRGWVQEFQIPFTSLGLSGKPSSGAVWGLSLAVHDRDDAAGTAIADKTWPEGAHSLHPDTWGQLHFGLPAYQPPNTPVSGSTMIRQGLNGAVVSDAAVGGTIDALCIGDSNYIWNQFGEANFGEAPRFNIQNQTDIADWPCFAKYYVKFPLAQVPPGKVILSATMTLHQFGGSSPNEAYRSIVHVLSLAEDWNEATLSWNNAPLGVENVSRSQVDVVSSCNWPCVPRTWDLTRAAAIAYSAGSPDLSLALYSVDAAYHSGKHFIASEEPDWNAVARPTLTIIWGDAPGRLDMGVAPPAPPTGATVTFSMKIIGTGESLSLIDQLPAGLGPAGNLSASNGSIHYETATHRVVWEGSPPNSQEVTISFKTPVTAQGTQILVNLATLSSNSFSVQKQASVIVNGDSIYIPLINR